MEVSSGRELEEGGRKGRGGKGQRGMRGGLIWGVRKGAADRSYRAGAVLGSGREEGREGRLEGLGGGGGEGQRGMRGGQRGKVRKGAADRSHGAGTRGGQWSCCCSQTRDHCWRLWGWLPHTGQWYHWPQGTWHCVSIARDSSYNWTTEPFSLHQVHGIKHFSLLAIIRST